MPQLNQQQCLYPPLGAKKCTETRYPRCHPCSGKNNFFRSRTNQQVIYSPPIYSPPPTPRQTGSYSPRRPVSGGGLVARQPFYKSLPSGPTDDEAEESTGNANPHILQSVFESRRIYLSF